MILTGIDFSQASLRGASLHAANLMNADLRGADLTGANLREADLISGEARWRDPLRGRPARGGFVRRDARRRAVFGRRSERSVALCAT
jgi:hypothetical protein